MKKDFATDITSIIACTFLLFISIWTCSADTDVRVLCVFFVVLVICYIATHPHFFVADEKGLTVYYIFFLKDYFAWEDIKRINEKYRYRTVVYEFEAKEHPQKVFFMTSEFRKNYMLKRLIKKYWQGEIEGDDWENLKKKIHKWKQKQNSFVPDDSGAEKVEREVRKKIREIINSYKPKAEAINKFIKAVYLYETKTGEHKNRPKESYSYNVEIEIGKIGSSDDESLYILNELLFVRYGKKTIKVMADETVFNEISEKLKEALEK